MPPVYDYGCKKCDLTFEIRHSMTEKPIVICPRCKSRSTSKVPSLVGVVVHGGRPLVMGRALDQVKRNIEMKNELRRDLGIEKIAPLRGATMTDVYKDAKAQASFIKETMAAQAESRAIETRKKQREWMKSALKRTPQRAIEKRERREAEQAKRRAISL